MNKNSKSNSLAVPMGSSNKLNDPIVKGSLGKGYSLMDWIRFSKSLVNKPSAQKITLDEVSKHNKVDDCWIILNDKVYNVTPYMKFHPGGISELMRGAGMNATDLFNQIHPWVNFQSMLENCLVGCYEPTKLISKVQTILENNTQSTNQTLNVPSMNLNIDKKNDVIINETPSIDAYQTAIKMVIVLYTKWKHMSNEFIVIDKVTDSNILLVDAYLENKVFEYSIDLPFQTKDEYEIKVSKDGKTEIFLSKLDDKSKQSPFLFNYKAKQIDNINCGINFRKCELIKRKYVTHDTDTYTFRLPNTCRMCVPCGHHVLLRLTNDHTIVKPYTPIYESLISLNEDEAQNGKLLTLMIKHYVNGALTSSLKGLQPGDFVEISNYMGSFDLNKLIDSHQFICLCAGSGFTPMVKFVYNALKKLSSIVTMVFFNKTTKDILWHDELNELASKQKDRFRIIHVLSQPDETWNGLRGKISVDLIKNVLNPQIENPFFCICGPIVFTKMTIEILNNMGFSNDTIHLFSG